MEPKAHASAFYHELQNRGVNTHRAGVVRVHLCMLHVCLFIGVALDIWGVCMRAVQCTRVCRHLRDS